MNSIFSKHYYSLFLSFYFLIFKTDLYKKSKIVVFFLTYFEQNAIDGLVPGMVLIGKLDYIYHRSIRGEYH